MKSQTTSNGETEVKSAKKQLIYRISDLIFMINCPKDKRCIAHPATTLDFS